MVPKTCRYILQQSDLFLQRLKTHAKNKSLISVLLLIKLFFMLNQIKLKQYKESSQFKAPRRPLAKRVCCQFHHLNEALFQICAITGIVSAIRNVEKVMKERTQKRFEFRRLQLGLIHSIGAVIVSRRFNFYFYLSFIGASFSLTRIAPARNTSSINPTTFFRSIGNHTFLNRVNPTNLREDSHYIYCSCLTYHTQ